MSSITRKVISTLKTAYDRINPSTLNGKIFAKKKFVFLEYRIFQVQSILLLCSKKMEHFVVHHFMFVLGN